MSGQQSMFVDPEHQDSEQRAHNTDPREQEGYGEGSSMYGGEPYYQGRINQEKIQPQRAKKPRFLPLVALLFVLALMFGGFSYFAAHRAFDGSSAQSSAYVQPPQKATWLAGETIIIRGNANDVHIHTVTGNEVLVQSSGNENKNAVTIHQEDGSLIINTDSGGFFGNSQTNLDVMIPQDSSVLQVDNNSGNVDLENINGTVQIKTDSGSIHAQHLTGMASLLSSSGDITVEAFQGNLQAATNSGEVNINQANLNETSFITTSSGSITYNGTLSSSASYQFSTSSGDISLDLTGESNLLVETHTQSGNVQNDFAASSGNVKLTTSSGDIRVHRIS